MAEKDFETDDPYEFVAVRFPMEPGVDGQEAMARCFVEEYALMGVPRRKILQIFSAEMFAGAHAVYEERGEAFIQRIIDDVFGAEPAMEVS